MMGAICAYPFTPIPMIASSKGTMNLAYPPFTHTYYLWCDAIRRIMLRSAHGINNKYVIESASRTAQAAQ
jgi:hypothetical protein